MNRFLKKIEKDESFLDCAISLSSMMEEKVRQNNAVEIYTDYFQVAFLTLIFFLCKASAQEDKLSKQ